MQLPLLPKLPKTANALKNFAVDIGLYQLKKNQFIFRYFYPRPWMFANSLFDKLTGEEWDSLFKDTYAVHFYASSSPTRKILRPKFYGKKVPAYSYLGVQHCPISFFSEKTF